MVDAGRATVAAALVAAVASFGTTAGTIAANVWSKDSAQPNCGAVLKRDVELAEAHPEIARLYASGATDLPKVGTDAEVRACGDPTALFKVLARKNRGR